MGDRTYLTSSHVLLGPLVGYPLGFIKRFKTQNVGPETKFSVPLLVSSNRGGEHCNGISWFASLRS
jgi:hypothetical protein